MIDLAEIHSLSEFQRNTRSHIRRLKKNGKPQVLTVNGRRVVFQGVNRHEFDPGHGRVLSEETMREDVLLMKPLVARRPVGHAATSVVSMRRSRPLVAERRRRPLVAAGRQPVSR